jgi:hypothetical protein
MRIVLLPSALEETLAVDPLALLIIATIAFPCGWLIAEFKANVFVRCLVGLATMAVLCFATAIATGVMSFQSNVYFGDNAKLLIDTTIEQLDNQNTEAVLASLKELQRNYHPTYEHRARFEELVKTFADSFGDPDAQNDDMLAPSSHKSVKSDDR